MSDAYVHGTTPSEQDRLALLNRVTNETFITFLGVHRGMRVLEVGSGLGILASAVASIAGEVVGVERSAEQIARAPRLPNLTIVQGDAHQLEFPDASFDLCTRGTCWSTLPIRSAYCARCGAWPSRARGSWRARATSA